MRKIKERKAFNFYASYYDVFKELSNKDKLEFIEAILAKQFNDVEPILTGMSKFAYLSQKHSIDKQVEGFKSKTNSELPTPIQDPKQGGKQDPKQQEKGKEEEKEKEEVKEIISYLNSKTGKSFKATTDKTKILIGARIDDSFELKDFKKVIDIKCEEWTNTDMEKFLRPETLFGTKFEGYLNQVVDNKPSVYVNPKMIY